MVRVALRYDPMRNLLPPFRSIRAVMSSKVVAIWACSMRISDLADFLGGGSVEAQWYRSLEPVLSISENLSQLKVCHSSRPPKSDRKMGSIGTRTMPARASCADSAHRCLLGVGR
jgi:hypothetical protein